MYENMKKGVKVRAKDDDPDTVCNFCGNLEELSDSELTENNKIYTIARTIRFKSGKLLQLVEIPCGKREGYCACGFNVVSEGK
jgi:hypothetical protein